LIVIEILHLVQDDKKKFYAVATGEVAEDFSKASKRTEFLTIRRHLVHNLTFTFVVPIWTRAECKFGLNVFAVLFLA
jgi:hypothetical protein